MDTTTIEAQLDEWLEGALAELDEPPADLDHAAKLLGAVRGINRRIEEVDQLVHARIAALREFREQQVGPLQARREHLEGVLQGWALAEWERTGRKTWKVPEGTIQVRPRQARIETDQTSDITDELIDQVDRFLPWAVKEERSLRPGEVKARARPGAALPDYPAPEGYTAHQAVVDVQVGALEDQRTEPWPVPGLVLLVPVDGRGGQVASVKPAGAL